MKAHFFTRNETCKHNPLVQLNSFGWGSTHELNWVKNFSTQQGQVEFKQTLQACSCSLVSVLDNLWVKRCSCGQVLGSPICNIVGLSLITLIVRLPYHGGDKLG